MEPAKIVGTWPLYIHHLGEHGQGGLELLAQGEFTVSTKVQSVDQTVTTANFDLARELEYTSGQQPIILAVLTNEEPTNSSSFFKMSVHIGLWNPGSYETTYVTQFGYSDVKGLNASVSGVTNYSSTDEGVYVQQIKLTRKSGVVNKLVVDKGSLEIHYKYRVSGSHVQANDPRGKYSYKVYLLPISVTS